MHLQVWRCTVMKREWGNEMLNFIFKHYNILDLLSNITRVVYVVYQPLVQVFMNNNLSLWITVPHKIGKLHWSLIQRMTRSSDCEQCSYSRGRHGRETAATTPLGATHSDHLLRSLCWVLPARDTQLPNTFNVYMSVTLPLANTGPLSELERANGAWGCLGVVCGQRVCSLWVMNNFRVHLLCPGITRASKCNGSVQQNIVWAFTEDQKLC